MTFFDQKRKSRSINSNGDFDPPNAVKNVFSGLVWRQEGQNQAALAGDGQQVGIVPALVALDWANPRSSSLLGDYPIRVEKVD